MGLDLRHGHEEVRCQHSAGEPEKLHARIARTYWCANQFVAIQVDESDLFVSKTLFITTLGEHQLCVPLVSRSLGDDHGLGSQSAE